MRDFVHNLPKQISVLRYHIWWTSNIVDHIANSRGFNHTGIVWLEDINARKKGNAWLPSACQVKCTLMHIWGNARHNMANYRAGLSLEPKVLFVSASHPFFSAIIPNMSISVLTSAWFPFPPSERSVPSVRHTSLLRCPANIDLRK